jgi:hypothetical protein
MTTKSLSSLLLGMTVLGTTSLALSVGQAHAYEVKTVCTFQICPVGSTATVGDKTLTTIAGPTAGAGKVEFATVPVIPILNGVDPWNFHVDVDFDTELTGPSNGSFRYNLKIDDNVNHTYYRALLTWAGVDATVTKNIFDKPDFLAPILTLASDGAWGDIPGGLKEIWVEDIYSVGPMGTLDNFQNNFSQVPGPLPLLGAGTAFGFSRRLRRRSKARFNLG